MKYIAYFRATRSEKETTFTMDFPDNLPEELVETWANEEARKEEKRSLPYWKLIKVVKED